MTAAMLHFTGGWVDLLEKTDIVFEPGESTKDVPLNISDNEELEGTYCTCLEIVSDCSQNAVNNQATVCVEDDESE